MMLFIVVCLLILAASVSSQGCIAGSVRLVHVDDSDNATTITSVYGRLEVCQSGLWHSVCADENLCTPTATVVCRQLGFSVTGAQVYGLALYGEGNGTVGLQNVSCTGTETNITQCSYTSPSICPHSMDAAVHCNPPAICLDVGGHSGCCDIYNCYLSYPHYCWCDETCYELNDCCTGIDLTCPDPLNTNDAENVVTGSTPCSSVGDVSFYDGNETVGRIAVCDTDYRWKTVCNEGFDANDAKVICRSVGLSVTNITVYNETEFGQGVESIFQKSLQCIGNESRVTDCHSYSTCCGHHRDVGIGCEASCSSRDLRLVGGTDNLEGRLEVCHKGRWGTVCDNNWDITDAQVACRTMALPWTGARAYNGQYTNNQYGGQSASGLIIWLNHVDCDENDDVLWDCIDEDEIGNIDNCQHSHDAGLICAQGPCELAGHTNTCCNSSTSNCQGIDSDQICHCSLDCEDHDDCCLDFPLICSCNNFELRLRDGTAPNEGRVEMCYKREWGTVCDDSWNTPDAQVVCNQLGYSTIGAQAFSFSYFGAGTGSIWLDNVFCSGTETHLVNCSANAIGAHNCRHYEDASVRCAVPGAAECVHGQARLARGPSDREGQLEVCYNGMWGTVCDDSFSQVDADVGCKTIFPSDPTGGAIFIQYSYQYFGDSTRDIVMDNVGCTGSEVNIVNCTHITNHNCYHYEDVGLACYPPAVYNGQPMLVPGPSAGRLLVYTSQSWGTVCKDLFDIEDAQVVCRELGQPTESPRVYKDLQFGRGYGSVKYSEVECVGDETHLISCNKRFSFYCSHYDDVGVGCDSSCSPNGRVRLVDGRSTTEGRVEVCRNDTWGTICDYGSSWGAEEAHVVCKQLNFPYTAAISGSYNEFGPGADPYHYSNVNCDGNEANIELCSKYTEDHECTSHKQDVSVVCLGLCNPGEVRLVGGTEINNGRLEICLGGYWGTVCDDQFDNVDALVVCKQLGLPYEGAEARYDALFGEGSDHIAITSLFCFGHEEKIYHCLFDTGSAVTCSHANDAGVICQDMCVNGAIRLSGGESVDTGRIEVCYNGNWGTICQKGWGIYDAMVACTQLGFNASHVRTFGGSKYGSGIGPVYLRDLQCSGNESSLIYCPGNTDTNECSHSDDAGLRCDGELLLNITSAVHPSLPPPGPISNATITVINSTSVTLHWKGPVAAQSVVTGYRIMINGEEVVLLGSELMATIIHLIPGVPYSYEITTNNIFATSVTYYSQIFFTAELAPSSSVNFSGERIDEYTISVSWIPLTLYQARGYITGYVIHWAVYDEAFTLTPTTAIVSANTTSFRTPTTLLPSKKYTVSVIVQTGNGTGPSTPIVIDTTSSAYFQLKLSLLQGDKCGIWTANNGLGKLNDIVETVAMEISTRCKHCLFGTDHIGDERFQCNSAAPTHALFRAQLFAPTPLTNDTIIGYILDWITSGNSILLVNGVEFRLDITCNPSGIIGFDSDFCAQRIEKGNKGLSIGVGVGVSGLVMIVVMIAVLVTIVTCACKTKVKHPESSSCGTTVNFARYFVDNSNNDKESLCDSGIDDDNFKETENIIAETST